MIHPHVAILDEELPYPLTSGKRIRTFNLVTRLASSFRITYIAHRSADEAEQKPAERMFREHGITPVVVDYRVPKKSGLGFHGRLLGNLASPLPYSVTSHASRAMGEAIVRLREKRCPDLWHCEWTPYAQAMLGRGVPWTVTAHNVESQIWQRYAEAETNPLKRWFLRTQWRKFELFECLAYQEATRTIAVSDEDARRIELEFAATNVAVVENGVDPDYFRPDPSVPRDPHRLLFLGSLDWRPNQDAVRLLLDEIMPLVQQREPQTTLSIVGRKPPDWLIAAARRPGVELFADVPDVRPHLHAAAMLVVPLRIGGGSRLKILEALATGTPVVTTTIGVEGLRLNVEEHVTVADRAEAIAAAVAEAMRKPSTEQATRGREKVLNEYGWSGLAEKQAAVWRSIIEMKRPTVPTT